MIASCQPLDVLDGGEVVKLTTAVLSSESARERSAYCIGIGRR